MVETERITSVPKLTANTDANILGIRTRSEGTLSHTDAHQFQVFRKWYFEEYRDKKITTPLEEYFTEDVWEDYLQIDTVRTVNTPTSLPSPPTFSPTKRRTNLTVDTSAPINVTSPLNTSPTADTLQSIATTTSINTTVKPDVKAYPVFNGSYSTWMAFKRRFIAVATAQKLDILLADTYVLPADMAERANHVEANKFLYSALQYCTADGTAHTRVDRFKKTKDGRSTFLHLVDWYESGGNKKSLATHAMSTIQNLRLSRNTPGGTEKYINDFEAAVMKLEDAGESYSDTMKKYWFLQNITDSTLESYKAICHSDATKTYQDCVDEIRSATLLKYDTATQQMVRRAHVPSRQLQIYLSP